MKRGELAKGLRGRGGELLREGRGEGLRRSRKEKKGGKDRGGGGEPSEGMRGGGGVEVSNPSTMYRVMNISTSKIRIAINYRFERALGRFNFDAKMYKIKYNSCRQQISQQIFE